MLNNIYEEFIRNTKTKRILDPSYHISFDIGRDVRFYFGNIQILLVTITHFIKRELKR